MKTVALKRARVALKRENTQFTAEKYLEFLAKRIMSCML